MRAVVEASMYVGWEKFISSGADDAIRARARAAELRFLDLIRSVILYQSLPMSAWVCLGLLRRNLNRLCKYQYAGFSNVVVALPLSTVEMFECDSIMPKPLYLTIVNMKMIGFSLS